MKSGAENAALELAAAINSHLTQVVEIFRQVSGGGRFLDELEKARRRLGEGALLNAWSRWLRWSGPEPPREIRARASSLLVQDPAAFVHAVEQCDSVAAVLLDPQQTTAETFECLAGALERSRFAVTAALLTYFYANAMADARLIRVGEPQPLPSSDAIQLLLAAFGRMEGDVAIALAIELTLPVNQPFLNQKFSREFCHLYWAACSLLSRGAAPADLEKRLAVGDGEDPAPALVLCRGAADRQQATAYRFALGQVFDRSDRLHVFDDAMTAAGLLRITASIVAIHDDLRNDAEWWSDRWRQHSEVLASWPSDRSHHHYDRLLTLVALAAGAVHEEGKDNRSGAIAMLCKVLRCADSCLDLLLVTAGKKAQAPAGQVFVQLLVQAFLVDEPLVVTRQIQRILPWIRTTALIDAALAKVDANEHPSVHQLLTARRQLLDTYETRLRGETP